jgi:hypothetical protein
MVGPSRRFSNLSAGMAVVRELFVNTLRSDPSEWRLVKERYRDLSLAMFG